MRRDGRGGNTLAATTCTVYSTVLRSLTQGKASHRQKFSHYEEVPKEEEGKIIAAAQAAKEEES